MKKFSFKFESVLKQRKIREQESLRVLGQAQSELQSLQQEKNLLQKNLDEALLRRESLGKTAVPVLSFHLEESFIQGTKQRISRTEQYISRATKAVERALRTYLLARKQSRAIELLREKELEEFKNERNQYEQKVLDDVTLMRTRLKEDSV